MIFLGLQQARVFGAFPPNVLTKLDIGTVYLQPTNRQEHSQELGLTQLEDS